MTTIVVLFNLKPGVDIARYEAWARSTDLPLVNALPSVSGFRVQRAQGLLGGGDSPYQYVELLEVDDVGKLGEDISTPAMQKVVAEFAEFADSPKFILTEPIG